MQHQALEAEADDEASVEAHGNADAKAITNGKADVKDDGHHYIEALLPVAHIIIFP